MTTWPHAKAERAHIDAQLTEIRAAAVAANWFHDGDARDAYWIQVWDRSVRHAAQSVDSDRKLFYGLRLTAVSSAVIVPSLVGLNLSGTGGTTVRWLTFALSLVAALSTAILTLFRFQNRWLICRKLHDELVSAAWAMLNSPAGDTGPPWTAFVKATNEAISVYNAEYAAEVIATAVQSRTGASQGTQQPAGT